MQELSVLNIPPSNRVARHSRLHWASHKWVARQFQYHLLILLARFHFNSCSFASRQRAGITRGSPGFVHSLRPSAVSGSSAGTRPSGRRLIANAFANNRGASGVHVPGHQRRRGESQHLPNGKSMASPPERPTVITMLLRLAVVSTTSRRKRSGFRLVTAHPPHFAASSTAERKSCHFVVHRPGKTFFSQSRIAPP